MSGPKPKPYAKHAHSCQAHGMEFGHYYVAEMSYHPRNPVYRYVVFNARGGKGQPGTVEVAGVGNEDNHVHLSQMAFFRVVEEIVAMRVKPSRFMPDDLPADATP